MTGETKVKQDIMGRIEAAIADRAKRFTKLSDEIWDFAELGFEETRSSAAQQEVMRAEGFTVSSGVGGLPTAFVAERGTGRPVIGLLGEFDALANMSQIAGLDREQAIEPGQPGHGCGHNLLGAGSALAAAAAADIMQSLGISGTIRYFACPAEEGGGGKAFMARAGMFGDLDAVFSWHPASASWAHTDRTNAFLQVRIGFLGAASHAALTPQLGRSALDAAELMNIGVNYLREHMLDHERIHYAYRDAGGVAANVVQARTEMAYIIRSPTMEGLQALTARVEGVAKGAALMTETELEFAIESGMSAYRPNMALTALMDEQLHAFGAPEFDEADLREAARFADPSLTGANTSLDSATRPMAQKIETSLGSTDVGDVSIVVPTAQIWMAAFARGTAFHSWKLVSQGKLPAAHKGMLQAAKVMAASAVHALCRPELLNDARNEHRNHFGDSGYRCPIPPGVSPPVMKTAAPRRDV